MKKLLFVIILLSGCASAAPQHSPVPEDQLSTVQCDDLFASGKSINQEAIKMIEEDVKLAGALKQIALSYYTVYTISCLEAHSDEYNRIRDYVADQQANLYDLHVDSAEVAECRNGVGM
ncbi:MAG: hypothetical protein PVI03_07900 [Candidatus Thorarchaeota archaeon]|jgi:hypothetical protein